VVEDALDERSPRGVRDAREVATMSSKPRR
jgi:hypothetical protein